MIPVPRELIVPLFALIAMMIFGGMAYMTGVVARRDRARRLRQLRRD